MTTTTKENTCPKCGAPDFGDQSRPATGEGWYGDRRVAWGRYAGVHMCRTTAKRCPECGHVEEIDPDFDD